MAEDQLFQPLTREQLLAQPPVFQPPQLPLQQQWPVQPDAIATPGAGINPTLFGDPGAGQLDRHAALAARADKLQAEQSSFLPNALAIGALLTGDFKPMMALQEQKRKTQLAQVFGPTALEATKLAQQGQLEQAEALITDVAGKVGDRSPELTQFFNTVRGDIKKEQVNWRDMAQVADYMKGVPDTAHPDVIRFRDFIQKSVKNRTPMSASLTASLFDKAFPEGQMFNNQSFQRGRLSGEIRGVPLPTVLSEKDVGGPVGEFLSSRLGLSLPEITDIVNLKQGMAPIETKAGPVAFGSREHQYVVQAHQDSMALRASQSFQEKTPLEPSIATALRRDGGATPLQIATGTYTPQQIDRAVTADQARKVGIASAAELTKIRQNPLLAEQSGLVNIDIDTGLPLRRGTSIDEIEKRGLNVVRLPVATFERYRSSVEALTALDNLEPFIENLGNPQKMKERIASGFNRWASDRLGVALTQNIEVSKAFEVMLNGAIEEAAQRQGINQNDKDIRLIKTFVTGAGASPEAGRRAVKEIQKRLADRIYQEVGEASLARPAGSTAPPATAPPSTAPPAGQQIPGVPTPNVRQVPAAGVEPGAAYRQPGGGFVPSGTTTYTPPRRGTPGKPKSAVEMLAPIVDQAPAATPGTPYQYVKPGSLK